MRVCMLCMCGCVCASVWIEVELLVLGLREISGFRYFVKMFSNSMIEELNYYAVHNVRIAHDDEQIEAHKIWLRKQSKCGFWHPATD